MPEPSETDTPRDAFIRAAVWHGSLDRAGAILASNPEIASIDIHTAALLGDAAAVRGFLARDAAQATSRGGPLDWDALTHLCFSRYLRLDPSRTPGFLDAATALLDAGASANTGFFDGRHQPKPEWESVLYAAAGVAHHAAMTRLLLERGADPNDGETPYHAPESYDNAALEVLVESGKLNADSMATLLVRKADWHDHDGMRYLLENGADPNRMTCWHLTALHQSVRRDNGIEMIEMLLDRGADAAIPNGADGATAISIAVRRGRADVLDALERRGIPLGLEGVEHLIAACARNDIARIQALTAEQPGLVSELLARGGTLLGEFAGHGNQDGVRQLLDLGVPVDALHAKGDGYFDVAPNSTALQIAAWRAQHSTVRLLIERGAAVNATDGAGRTALKLAVKACVDSYWAYRRTTESVESLLDAGAAVEGIKIPCGYEAADELLAAR